MGKQKFSRIRAQQGFINPVLIPLALFLIVSLVLLNLTLRLAIKHYITPWMAVTAVPLFWVVVWMIIKVWWLTRKHEGPTLQVVQESPSLETQVLDAAFKLAQQVIPSISEAEAKDKLQQMFPTMSPAQIADSYLRARALADVCYDTGNQCREKRMTDREAVERLRQQFPGFSPRTYSHALSWGYFLSR